MKYLVLLSFLLTACVPKKESTAFDPKQYFSYGDSVEAAGVKLITVHTPKGDFKVWTKRFGTHPRIKILLLHGGPGMTHEYMECFETFFQKEGFEFYEYDQLGSYYSEQPGDSTLWNTARFVDEVDQVRKAIGADSSNFYIIGNSWGGILGMEYALKHQNHLKGLVVANMMASIPEYNRYSARLAAELPPDIFKEIKALENKRDFGNPRYMELLMDHYYPRHICRLKDWPDGVQRAFKHTNGQVYTLMQGPSEMGIIGNALLSDWDIKGRLGEIRIPTLMVGARYDTMDPQAMEEQSRLVQKGRYLYCPEGSHLAMWDDQATFMNGVISFVKDVDNGTFR